MKKEVQDSVGTALVKEITYSWFTCIYNINQWASMIWFITILYVVNSSEKPLMKQISEGTTVGRFLTFVWVTDW